ESTGRRLAFARWLTDRQNPLFARVAANHIWARHFSEGIVPSLADFGRNGRPPSHPRLLDWLASEMMQPTIDDGRWTIEKPNHHTTQRPNDSTPNTQHPAPWSMKHLHRLIVTSSTYRMASTTDISDAKADPDDVYLWRYPYKRMEAEVVRDNMLWVSGQ